MNTVAPAAEAAAEQVAITEATEAPIVSDAPDQPNVYLRHFRLKSDTNDVLNHGGATIAFEYEGPSVRYSVAFCHKNDNFSRMKGRRTAIGRLCMGSRYMAYHLETSPKDFEEILDTLADATLETQEQLVDMLYTVLGIEPPAALADCVEG